MEVTRRRALAHCSALLAAALGIGHGVAADAPQRILVVGDSLSAEYGLARGSGWVALLEQRLAREHIDATVVNASISGDTTSGGRARLRPLLRQHHPTLVVIELGANDALRGLPIEETRANLVAMAEMAKTEGARVVLVGMQIPPNYGRRYAEQFAAMYADAARETGSALVPFMLKGVADAPDAERLFQPDRIHPLAAAHPTILANIWPVLEPTLRAAPRASKR
ncbi:MAG TPA: arylesterase [Caldimonas sp.]|nr:arylesterase [Caldimonas sp.]